MADETTETGLGSSVPLSVVEVEFLLEEFKTAWAHLGLLDGRRFDIFRTYVIVFVGTGGGAAWLLTAAHDRRPEPMTLYAFLAVAGLAVCFFAFCCRNIIKSERRATERFRDKINHLRKMFIGGSSSQLIKDYLVPELDMGVRIDPVQRKELKFLQLFEPDKRATALYVVAFIDIGAWLSGFAGLVAAVAFFKALP